MPGELRTQYRERLLALEDNLLRMGDQVRDMLAESMRALAERDLDRAAATIRADDRVDERYRQTQEGVFTLMALQAPVASDLRLVSGLIHINVHLERMGDLCVNIAKFAQLSSQLRRDAELLGQLQEMSQHANRVIARSLEAFARRDVAMVQELPALDDPIDRLNKGLFRRLAVLAGADERHLDWAMQMVLVSRYLERLGDHAVDIGEQVVFIVTGETVELASNSP